MKTELSIVIAVHNEAGNIKALIGNIDEALSNKVNYDVIFVDDGSNDDTVEVIKKHLNKRITLIKLKRNVGQSAALQAGIDFAEGEYIATMDGDLQNDAHDLPNMLNVLKEKDCDFVTGIRENRNDKFLSRKLPSKIANYIVQKVSNTDIKDNGCGIKVFRSDVLKELNLYGEKHRFLASFAAMEGASYEQVPVRHHPRIHGKSKYSINRTLKVIADLLLINFSRRFGQKPMYLFGVLGFGTSVSGAIILLLLLMQKLAGYDIWGKPLLILGVMFFFIGLNLITTGIILDMFVRNRYEIYSIKPYKINRVFRAE